MPKRNLPPTLAIGERLRQIRDFRGYSQEYVAQQVGISQQHLSDIEKDSTDVGIQRLSKICMVLEVELSDVLDASQSNSFINSTVQGFNNHVHAPVTNSYTVLPEHLLSLYETTIAALRSENELLRKQVVG